MGPSLCGGYLGIMLLYKVYAKLNLRVLKLKHYEDILVLVIEDNQYGEQVPVQIVSTIIDKLIQTMTQQELHEAGKIWKKIHTIAVLSKKLHEENPEKTQININTVRAKVVTTKKVVLKPLWMITIKGVIRINIPKGYTLW